MRIRMKKDEFKVYELEEVCLKNMPDGSWSIQTVIGGKRRKLGNYKEEKVAKDIFNGVTSTKCGEIYTVYDDEEEYKESRKIKFISKDILGL